jgi:predicted metal-dependent hydrolase
MTFDDLVAEPAGLPVEVIRSTRRRKTISAQEVGGVLRISIPARSTKAQEAKYVEDMVRRMARRRETEEVDLTARAALLAERHDLPLPQSIRWVDNQQSRWGSCTPDDGTIRISSRLAEMPSWVLDYVIVHELAHLAELGHNERFYALADRYPKAERARGYLIAKGLEDE